MCQLKVRQESHEPANDRERYLSSLVKTGGTIVVVGLFLSPFGLSLLLGATGEILLLTAIQSAIVVLIGIAIAGKSRFELRKSQRKRERSADTDRQMTEE